MGNNTNSVVEINGKRYDAISGAFLGDIAGKPSQAVHTRTAIKPRPVDGFKINVATTQPKPARPAQVSVARPAHTPAVHAAHHKPQPARTLMRTAVKKPAVKSPVQLKAQIPTDILARAPKHVVAPKVSYSSIDPSRLKKAVRTVQSPAVSHYSAAKAIPTPAHSAFSPLQAQPAAKPTGGSFDFKTSAAKLASPARVPAIPVAQERTRALKPNMFEEALSRATSHEQPLAFDKKSQRRGRIAGIVTGALCLLIVAGIVAYFNAPVLSMHLASAKAGFEAKLPSYSPVGYSFGNVSYGPGNITVSYKDGSQSFNIVQRSSAWDSEALLNNFVSTANKAYQTYERAGRTIYLYGNNTATWVDSGVWYTVNGNASLDKSQLLDLASSM